MAKAKARTPLALIERARKHAEASRLMYDPVRALYEELSEAKDLAQTYVDDDPTQVAESLTASIEALTSLAHKGIGVSAEQVRVLEAALADLDTLPDTSDLQTFIDAVEMLGETLDALEAQRDDPSSSTADERSYTRDQARENLDAVADALEALEPVAPEQSQD